MFEHRDLPLISRPRFLRRVALSVGVALAVLACALGIGMVGYHSYEEMSWIDAYANAAMILSGMGPLTAMQSNGGKLFAGTYALFSGLTFITVVGVVLSPIVHRVLHRFHLEAIASELDESDD
jgi:FtsH-binding integral membrane protein